MFSNPSYGGINLLSFKLFDSIRKYILPPVLVFKFFLDCFMNPGLDRHAVRGCLDFHPPVQLTVQYDCVPDYIRWWILGHLCFHFSS